MGRMSFVDVALRLRGANRFAAEVTKATTALEGMGLRGANALGSFAKKAAMFKHVGRQLTTGLTLPIAAVGGASVYAAMEWESSFAGVRKTVDATRPELSRLNDELIAMSLEIPVSASELANIAEAAGQLGIKTEAIGRFTRVMADLGATTNMTSTEAAESLARFANITQMSQGDFDRLGSTVVDLGNKLAATETDIVNMGLRIAGAGNQVGLSEAQIMAFAGALSSVGIRAEMGGTAISTAFLEANSAVIAGGSELNKFASIAGVSASKFRQQWKANAGLAMTEFLEGLRRISNNGGDVKATLEDLGLSGTRMRDTLMRAAGAGNLLRRSLALGNKAWKENNALTIEADKRYKTTESRFQILKNTLFALGVVIGSVLLPPLTKIATWLGGKITAAAKWFEKQSKTLKIALVGLAVAAALLGPILFGIGVIASGVGAAMMIATSPITLIVIAVAAAVAALIILYHRVEGFRKAIDFLVDAWVAMIKGIITGVSSVVSFVKNNWKLILSALIGPVMLAATLITKHWGTIKRAVSSAVRAIINFVKRNWKTIVSIMAGPMGIAVVLVIASFGKLRAAASAVVKFIVSRFQSVISFFKGLPGKISSAVAGAFDGIKEAFRSAINFIIRGWNNLDLSLSIAGKTVSIGSPNIPELATGGTVTRPGLTMVGERGPELLSLPRAASVIPLSERVVNNVSGPQRIEVPVYLNGRQIAMAVADEVSNAGARA